MTLRTSDERIFDVYLLRPATPSGLDAVSGVWEPSRVGVKLSPGNGAHGMSDSDPDALFTHVARELGSRFLAYLHLFEPAGVREAGVSVVETLSHLETGYFRPRFRGTLMANGGYDVHTAEAAVRQGRADLIAFARLFVANPDLPERFARSISLNRPDPATFYGGGERGHTDYPSLAEQERTQR